MNESSSSVIWLERPESCGEKAKPASEPTSDVCLETRTSKIRWTYSHSQGTDIGGFKLDRPVKYSHPLEIWRAEHPTYGTCIVKTPHVAFVHNIEGQYRLENEVLSLSLLNGEDINVPVLVGSDPNTHSPYLAMEFLEGVDLRDLMPRFHSQPLEALRVAVRFLRTLQKVHDKGLLHLDIKPGNIRLVHEDGVVQPYLLDFDISKLPFDLAQYESLTSKIRGTIEYMAPEHIEGASDLDRRTDLYATAKVVNEMLTGRSVRPRIELSDYKEMEFYLNVAQAHKYPTLVEYQPSLAVFRSLIEQPLAYKIEDRNPSAAHYGAQLEQVVEIAQKKLATQYLFADLLKAYTEQPEESTSQLWEELRK